ncbi:MAG: UpxY family transcription antiterminator [Terriglobia bacterium]
MAELTTVGNTAYDPAWYALHTRYQHEKAVAQALSNKQFEVFLPLYNAVHHWKDRIRQLSLPLFPCYVFIRGGLNRRVEVISTPGIHAYVGVGWRPIPIPDQEIAAVRRTITNCARVEPHPFLKCGDWVRVKYGPLEGIEGILVRKKNQFRLVLSVTLLHQAAAVEVDASIVGRVSKANDSQAVRWEKGYAPALA